MKRFTKIETEYVYNKSSSHEGPINRYVYRKISLKIAVISARFGLSPNQLTYISFFLSILSAVMFVFDNRTIVLLGLLPFHLGKIVDCADGQLALLINKKSQYGAFIDPFLDRIVDISILSAFVYATYQRPNSGLNISLLILVLVLWFLSAYLQTQGAGSAVQILKQSSISNSKFKKIIKWDGGFSGLVYSFSIIYLQVTPLLMLYTFVGIPPLLKQLIDVIKQKKTEDAK